MVAGIALDAALAVPLRGAVAAAVLAGGVLLVGRRHWFARGLAVVVAGGALGAVLHENAFRRIPVNHIVRYTADEPVLTIVTGTLAGEPVVYEREGGHFARWIRGRTRTRFVLDAEQIAGRRGPVDVTGLVRVTVKEPVLDLAAGQRVRLIGRLYRPISPQNPGQPDFALLSQRQGIRAGLSCKAASSITPLDADGWRRGAGIVHRLRRVLRLWLYEDLTAGEDAASVLDAIVLGQRGQVAREINEAFIRTGTAHFLSVSGTHVGMLAVFVWLLVRGVGMERPAGAIVVFVVVAGYVLVAEPRVPILRAGILCGLGCIAVGLRRRTSPLNWLAAGAVILLAWRPCDLFGAGFQLSFGIVLAILLLGPVVHAVFDGIRLRLRRVPPELDDPIAQWPTWRRTFERVVTTGIWLGAISITAWLVGSVLTAYHFQRFSPWGWLNSLLVWPFVMLIVTAGLAKVLLAMAWPQTTLVTGPLLGWASSGLVTCVNFLSRLPGVSIECRPPATWSLWLYFAGLLAIAICWRVHVRARWLVLLAAVPIVAVAAGRSRGMDRPDALEMWALAVGNGQVVLLRTPDAGDWVCDAGTLSGFDIGEVTAVPAFRHLGVQRIERAVVSHANFDHYGGLLAIDDHFPIGQVVMSPHFARRAYAGGAARYLLDQFARRKIPLRTVAADDRIDENAISFEALWPPADLPETWSSNDRSLVVRIGCAGRSILICGDVEDEAQRALIERGGLRSDVLVLPHHGAVAKSTAPFLAAVDPQVIVRSGGTGRPTAESIIAQAIGQRAYFDTARDGAVVVRLGADGLRARAPFRSPAASPIEHE